MATAVMVVVPEARQAVATKAEDVKNKIKKRLQK
jgi:hypothetical protein